MRRETWLIACDQVAARWPFPSLEAENEWRRELWDLVRKLRGEIYEKAILSVVADLIGEKMRGSARPSPRQVASLVLQQLRYEISYVPPPPVPPEERKEVAEKCRAWRSRRGFIAPPEGQRQPGEEG